MASSLFPGNRVETFSDGVFAIVLTLLVLELKVPVLPEGFSSHDGLHALVEMIPEFVSFATSFLVIAIFWVNHHHFMHSVRRVNTKMLWLNNLLLFWLCFIPFPTAFIGRYHTELVPVLLYTGVLALTGLSFNLLGRYAFFSDGLYDPAISHAEKVKNYRQSFIGTALYGLAFVIAPFSLYVALGICIVTPLLYFVPRHTTAESE